MYACTGDNENSWVCVITRGIKIIFIHVPTMIISFIYTCITELHKCILYITLNIVHFKPTCTCSFAYQQSLNLSDTCTCKRQRLSCCKLAGFNPKVSGRGGSFVSPSMYGTQVYITTKCHRGYLHQVFCL